MTQQSGILLPSAETIDVAEKRYTEKFLDGITDMAFEWGEELELSEYATFYCADPAAGYAFHKLETMFKEIDKFVCGKPGRVTDSPFGYFSNVEVLVTFSRKMAELTETLQKSAEPPAVEKIRIVDRNADRKKMFKRIIDVEPSKRTFESDVLENLKDRHKIMNAFWKAVYTERDRKKASKSSNEGSDLGHLGH
jgi:hypothetical protein